MKIAKIGHFTKKMTILVEFYFFQKLRFFKSSFRLFVYFRRGNFVLVINSKLSQLSRNIKISIIGGLVLE